MQSLLFEISRLVPKNAFSRGLGRLTRSPMPHAAHQAAIRAFVKAFGVKAEEAELPLEEYETFAAFFARRLRPGLRPIEPDPSSLVSPCDGAVGAMGRVERGTLLQAKGRPYGLASFLGDEKAASVYEGGRFLTIYLAPFDYHRVHFPADGQVVESRHIPGTLWPVTPTAVDRVEDLFAVNERLVTHMRTAAGPLAVVMVGATCVGRIRMLYDEGVTNAGRSLGRREYEPGIEVRKGDELGVFEMGSTVVLLSAPGSWSLDLIESGARARMGEVVGRRVQETR
ncbi:MAG: archaetidylserine decarboxylase [Myxococcota bacterium]